MEDSCKTLGQLPQEEPQHQKYQGPRPSMKGAGTEKAGEPWALKADRPVEPQAVLRGFRQGAHLSEPPTPRTAVLLVFRPSVVSDSAAPWTAARQASLSFTISRSSLKLMYDAIRPSQLLCPLLPMCTKAISQKASGGLQTTTSTVTQMKAEPTARLAGWQRHSFTAGQWPCTRGQSDVD